MLLYFKETTEKVKKVINLILELIKFNSLIAVITSKLSLRGVLRFREGRNGDLLFQQPLLRYT